MTIIFINYPFVIICYWKMLGKVIIVSHKNYFSSFNYDLMGMIVIS